MNEEYLWDKSGEPDPQIQELEELLAPLRYQPRPLELPREVRRRSYVPFLAIAASVVMVLLAVGIWLRSRTEKSQPPQQANSVPSIPSVPSAVKETIVENTDLPKKQSRNRKRSFNQREHQEALAAKQQVMLALRLASEKLKLAQRRTQTPSPNQIKNQHRVG